MIDRGRVEKLDGESLGIELGEFVGKVLGKLDGKLLGFTLGDSVGLFRLAHTHFDS